VDDIAMPVSPDLLWSEVDRLLRDADALPDQALSLIEDVDRPLRLPIEAVTKQGDRRVVCGCLAAGRLTVGESLVFLPSNKTAQVAAIDGPGGDSVTGARAGETVGLVLSDHIFIERGQIAAHLDEPPAMANRFRARLVWLGDGALEVGMQLPMILSAAEHRVEIESIEWAGRHRVPVDRIERGVAAEVMLRSRSLMALDTYAVSPATGRFTLFAGDEAAGAGVVVEIHRPAVKSGDITAVSHRVMAEERWQANGHRGGILWLTGLSGSGKSTIAMETERELFRRGYHAFVIDGDNVRHGLNADLGFSPKDRTENIRRVGEVASLFAQAGMVVITAFISPYIEDRQRARAIAPGHFHEVYVKADLATCESRDPKGLYKKARAGQIPEFTGISAPYEAPEAAELVLETAALSIDATVAALVDYIEQQFSLRQRRRATLGDPAA
jgi:bifunctional enzyme CysN/CysC